MSKIILYSAISLDFNIARADGSVGWLEGEGDYGYNDFIKNIGTTLMGANTYRQVAGFGEWPYSGFDNYVFTRKSDVHDKKVNFIRENIGGFCKKLKENSKKDIWLIGGGAVNSVLLSENLIDEMQLFVFPLLIGDGISLFKGNYPERKFELIQTEKMPAGVNFLKYKKI